MLLRRVSAHPHRYRLLATGTAASSLVLLLLADAFRTYVIEATFTSLQTFGFATFVAAMYLAVGTLVWLYARDRVTARLMYGVSCAVMIPFALETAAAAGDQFAEAVSSASSSLGLLLFALLLLHFPQNMLSTISRNPSPSGWRVSLTRLVRGYRISACVLCFFALMFVGSHAFAAPPPWLESVYNLYNVVVLAGIVATMAISYRSSPSIRERQQRQFFVWGVVLSLSPLLMLTVVPETLQNVLPIRPVDGQLSAVALVLLPIAFGYSILRYQLLVFDTYVRRVVIWIIGAVSLAVLVYIAQSTLDGLGLAHGSSLTLVVLSLLTILAPCLWFVAKAGTERLFFAEVRYYRHFFRTPTTVGEHVLGLDEVARLLVTAARQAFEAPNVCLFVLNEEGSVYQSCLPLNNGRAEEEEQSFVQKIAALLSPGIAVPGSLDPVRYPTLFERLVAAQRPLLLGELLSEEQGLRLSRYVNVGQQEGMDTLIAPIKAQGVVIGILVLGPRGEQSLYAGPDFEIVRALLGQFSPYLETARVSLSLKTTNVQLRAANTQLRDAYQQLQELDHLKDEFITIASHELRTPLTAVQGYIALLREYTGDDEILPPSMREDFLAKADRGCEELTLLLGNMTNAGDIEKSAQRVTLADVSLHSLTVNVTEILEALLRQEQHTIEIDVSPDLCVKADGQALGQVIRNLIVNAIKYSPAGTLIEVTASCQEEQVILSVRDHGLGIPPTDQLRLFHRFVRLERDMNSPTRGSGLGLYISQQLVIAMGGRIWVESSGIEGEGSIFKVALPLVLAPLHQEKNTLLSQAVSA